MSGDLLQTKLYVPRLRPFLVPRPHLLLITREDLPLPLARLRANNFLTEIRARELCFNAQDTVRFLETGGLSLSQTDVVALEDKTEGRLASAQPRQRNVVQDQKWLTR